MSRRPLKRCVSPTRGRDVAAMPAPSVPLASRKGAVLATSLFQWSPTPATSLSRSLTATSASAPAPPCQCVGGSLTSPPVSSSASPAPRGSRPGLASPGPGPGPWAPRASPSSRSSATARPRRPGLARPSPSQLRSAASYARPGAELSAWRSLRVFIVRACFSRVAVLLG